MVNVKRILFLLLLLCNSIQIFPQSTSTYSELSKYSNFGFTFGGVLFDKAKIEYEEGTYQISTIPIPSYSFGFYYDFPIYGKWSMQTGLIYVREAALGIKYKFFDEDIYYIQYNEEVKTLVSPLFTKSIPLSVKYKTKIGNKSYLELKLGMKMMLLPPAYVGSSNFLQSDTGICRNFRIQIYSPNNVFIHGSILTSIGYKIDLKNILIGFEFSRTINFQETFSGRFIFYNLLTNPDAFGYYNLTGNYWAFNININFQKRKYWKKKNK
jgi:hypothetical protein